MPRTGGIYTPPAGTKGVSNTTIQSAPYNAFIDDLTDDANAARPVTAGGTGATTATGARTNLGVAIGTDVQAYDVGLASIAGLTTSADQMIYTTGSDAYATTALTAFGRSILDDADATTARATLDVASITDMKWLSKAIGEIYIVDTSKTGVDTPPSGTGGSTVWVELTAGLTGSGQFNESKLINESVSGSAPLVLATAEISVSGSPMNGTVIDLLNTEGRIVRPSTSAGTKQNDAMQVITGSMEFRRTGGGAENPYSFSGPFQSGALGASASTLTTGGALAGRIIDFDTSLAARTSTETRMKNVGVTAYMRVK